MKIIVPCCPIIFRNIQSTFKYIVYLVLSVPLWGIILLFSSQENEARWGTNHGDDPWNQFPNLMLFQPVFIFENYRYFKYKIYSCKCSLQILSRVHNNQCIGIVKRYRDMNRNPNMNSLPLWWDRYWAHIQRKVYLKKKRKTWQGSLK